MSRAATQAERDLTQMQIAVSAAEASQAVAEIQQPSSSSTAPATEGRQAEGGLELTVLKRDDEADLDENVADGP